MLDSFEIPKLNKNKLISFFVFIMVVCWISLLIPDPIYFLYDPDGGHQLAGAKQILFGEHPFIDFRSTYGPLVFYTSYLGQVFSGNRIIGEIVLDIIGYTIAYVLLFRLAWLASGKLSIAFICTLLALLLIPRIYKYYLVLGPVLTLSATWRYVEKVEIRSIWYMGIAITFTGLFRFDFGVYTFACGLVAILLCRDVNKRKRNKEILIFLVSIIVSALPWLLWAFIKGGLSNYFFDTFSGLVNQSTGLSLPFPSFQFNNVVSVENGVFLLFFLFYFVPLSALILVWIKRKTLEKKEIRKVIPTIILAQGTLVQSTHRSDIGHLLQSVPISIILIGYILGILVLQFNTETILEKICTSVGIGVIISLFAISVCLAKPLNLSPRIHQNFIENIKIFSGSRQDFLNEIQRADPFDWQLKVIRYIQHTTSKTQRILAIPFLPNIYYWADRPFGSGQMLLAPGYFSTEKDQINMITRMSREEVNLVVEIPDMKFDNRADREIKSYVPVFYKYLNNYYSEIAAFGPAVIKINTKKSNINNNKL